MPTVLAGGQEYRFDEYEISPCPYCCCITHTLYPVGKGVPLRAFCGKCKQPKPIGAGQGMWDED